MSDLDPGLLEERAEDLFEDAPCGYLSTAADGTILKVNRTFETWTGLRREELIGRRRLQQLLAPGDRIYHETHVAPLLQMQGAVRAIAVEMVRADGSRLPALINATLRTDGAGGQVVRATVFDATDRRRYEQELLRAKRREEDIALQLQRSLLAGSLPEAPGLEIAVTYRPAVRGLEVGGDWYDAFWLDDGHRRVALVVGDVVGRGLGAAATMGQLRSAVRALASTGLGPAEVLQGLDAYACRHEVGRMATVAYAEVELSSGEVRYACAGHPPPLLLEPGDPPRFGWDGRSQPVDALLIAQPRPEGIERLRPGGAVLLYSDGLVEVRGEVLDVGLDRLAANVDTVRDRPVDRLSDAVVRAAGREALDDDLCLLVARVG